MSVRRIVPVSLLCLLVCAPLAACSSGGDQPADRWSVAVKGDADTEVQVSEVKPTGREADSLRTLRGGFPLASGGVMHLALKDGGSLGNRGATIRVTLPSPVPKGRGAALMYFDRRDGVWVPVRTRLASDRKSVAADVSHFSNWIAATVSEGASWALYGSATVLGARAESPIDGDCHKRTGDHIDGLPRWVSDVIFIDDRNAPLRSCAGSDSEQKQQLLLRSAVNRGYGVTFHSSRKPQRVTFDWGEGPMDWMLRGAVVPGADQLLNVFGGDLPAMPKQVVGWSYSGTESYDGSSDLKIEAKLDAKAAVAGDLFDFLAGQVLEGKIGKSAAYFAALATIGQCQSEIGSAIAKRSVPAAFSALGGCLRAGYEPVTHLVADLLLRAYPKEDPRKLGRIAGRVGKALKALTVVRVGLDATEWVNDRVRLPKSGLQLTAFGKIKKRPLSETAARLIDTTGEGSYKVGFYTINDVYSFGEDAPTKLTDVERKLGPGDQCTAKYNDAKVIWGKLGIEAEFTTLGGFVGKNGQPLDENPLDAACRYRNQVYTYTATATSRDWHTTKGLRTGDSEARLHSLYPSAAVAKYAPQSDTNAGTAYALHTIQLPWDQAGEQSPDVVAVTRSGKVVRITVVIGAQGE